MFYERLTALCTERHMTVSAFLKEMASRLGVSATRVNYWEKGKAEPGVAYIFKLCDLLDVSCDWLIGLSPINIAP